MNTPDECVVPDEDERRIRAVLDRATEDYASLFLAENSGMDADTCEAWIDRFYHGLRTGLDDEERLIAICALLKDEAATRAYHIECSMEV